jgi:hypothetical protein
MTLLGNAVLSHLWESHRYRILPFPGGRGSGEVIEVYPRATLRQMGLANYKSRPDEAIRRAIAACTAVGITLDIDPRLPALCCRYSSGGKTSDYDAPDAFVALCTVILHAEGVCRMAMDGDTFLKGSEGAVWVPRIAWSKPAELPLDVRGAVPRARDAGHRRSSQVAMQIDETRAVLKREAESFSRANR